MINAKIILDTRRETKKGFPVKIRVTCGISKYVSLKIFQKNKKLKITPEIRHRNLKLVQEVEFCNKNRLDLDTSLKVIKEGLNTDVEIFALKNRIEKLQNTSNVGILNFFDVIINEKKNKGDNTKTYEEVKKYISEYIIDEDYPINDITYEWLKDFKLFKKNAPSGINTYLRTIRAVYKEAQRRTSLKIKADNPFLGLIKSTAKKEIVQTSIKDLQKLLEYTPNKNTSKINAFKIQQKLDVWLFQFLIGGHDLIDIANLKKENIQNNRIIFQRYKNRNKTNGGEIINNKIFKKALEIIEKYPSKNEKLFDFIPYPTEKKYADFRNNYNRALRSISKSLKLSSVLKSKTPRYIFRSLAGEMLLDTLVIMQIQGHTPTGVTFTYQRNLPLKIIDKQHKKLIKKIFKKSKKETK